MNHEKVLNGHSWTIFYPLSQFVRILTLPFKYIYDHCVKKYFFICNSSSCFVEEGKWKDISFPFLNHAHKDSIRISHWYRNRAVYSYFIHSWTKQLALRAVSVDHSSYSFTLISSRSLQLLWVRWHSTAVPVLLFYVKVWFSILTVFHLHHSGMRSGAGMKFLLRNWWDSFLYYCSHSFPFMF